MKKTNLMKKTIRVLVAFLIIQFLIVTLFILAIRNTAPINEKKLKSSEIIIDQISYEYQFLNGGMVEISSNSIQYSFPKIPIMGTDEYSMIKIYESVNPGDVLVVKFVEEKNNNLIIEARLDDKILRTVDGYNSNRGKQCISCIVVFVIAELIFLVIAFFFVLVHYKELKSFVDKVRFFGASKKEDRGRLA